MPMTTRTPPIVSIVGYSGSGKTTYLENLIPALAACGIKVATIKHDVHGFEMDKPGKDSYRHKKAGAAVAVISSATQIGLVMDADHDHEPAELARLFPQVDIILTEGFKTGNYPKLEIFRPEATENKTLICQDDPNLLAVISDRAPSLPQLHFRLDDVDGAAQLLIKRFGLSNRRA